MAETKSTTPRTRKPVVKCAKHPDRKAVGVRPGHNVWPGIWVDEKPACADCMP